MPHSARRRVPKRLGLLVALSALVVGTMNMGDARAGDPPHVRIILPRSAMSNAGTETTTSADVVLDQQLPAGQEFFLDLPVDKKNDEMYASVELWPKPDSGECKDPTPNVEQHYRFGMQRENEGDQAVLRAKVPKLQIGTGYCVRVLGRTSIPDSTASGAASEASLVIENRAVTGACVEAITQDSFDTALSEGLKRYKFKGDATAAARKARAEFDKDGKGRDRCDALEKTKTAKKEADDAVVVAEKELATQITKIREVDDKGRPSDSPVLPSVTVRAPMVRVFNENWLATEVLDDAKLDPAIKFLDQRIAQNETDFLKSWKDKLTTLKREGFAARVKLAEKDSLFVGAPDHPFELWTGQGYISMRQFKVNLRADGNGGVVTEVPLDSAMKQLTFRMKERWTIEGKENPLVVRWISALQVGSPGTELEFAL